MSCSETNPELWERFLTVFKNIFKYDFQSQFPVTEAGCQEFIDDVR